MSFINSCNNRVLIVVGWVCQSLPVRMDSMKVLLLRWSATTIVEVAAWKPLRRKRSWLTTSSTQMSNYVWSLLQLFFRCSEHLVVMIHDLLLASILGWHCRSSASVAYPLPHSIFPIQCDEEFRNRVQQELPCQLLEFLCGYLGLPLSLKKLARDQIQPFIDRIADQLPGWKVDLL
jgi:hypothetical protein